MENPLTHRIRDGRTDLVFDHVAAGHPGTATDERGVPLVRWCAYYGDVSAIRFLQAQGASLDALGENIGLNEAAFHGHWQLCQFLLESGADANHALADTGETPLHAALCKANRPAYDLVVQVLLSHGADPNAATRPGIETGAFMRDSWTKGETPLHRAAAFGSAGVIKLLLDAGATIEVRDAHGESPLAWASWHLRPDAILRLLCYGSFSIHPDRHSTYDHGAGLGPDGCRPPAPARRRVTRGDASAATLELGYHRRPMTTTSVVRPAARADIPQLVELMQEFYAESSFVLDQEWAASAFASLLAEPACGAVWIIERNGAPIGHIVLTVRFTMEFGGLSGYIDDLFVRPEYRRQGAAGAALETLIAECRRRGCRSLHVEVGADNEAASALYRRHGLAPGDDRRQFLRAEL